MTIEDIRIEIEDIAKDGANQPSPISEISVADGLLTMTVSDRGQVYRITVEDLDDGYYACETSPEWFTISEAHINAVRDYIDKVSRINKKNHVHLIVDDNRRLVQSHEVSQDSEYLIWEIFRGYGAFIRGIAANIEDINGGRTPRYPQITTTEKDSGTYISQFNKGDGMYR